MRCRTLFGNVPPHSMYILRTIYRKYQDYKNARYYFIAARLKWLLLLLLVMVTAMLLLLFVAGEYFAQRLLVFPMRNMWVYRQSYLVSSSGFLHNPKLSKSHIRARSSPNPTLSVLSGIGNLNWEEKIIKKDRRERERSSFFLKSLQETFKLQRSFL